MQEASDFVLFLGRFHPLVVHLPIGILLFAFLLELIGRFQRQTNFSATIKIALLLGALSALFASILGYMLSQSGDYEAVMLSNHLWFGMATTIITFLAWIIKTNFFKLPNSLKGIQSNVSLLSVIVVLVSMTGHYGGNLTHGSDYLTKYAPFNENRESKLPELASLDEVVVYPYLVKPILAAKCYSCHNESKQKGGLAMYSPKLLLKGGKNGPIFTKGDSQKSEIFKRIILQESDEEFMPPEGKTPLTEKEIEILKFWIDSVKVDFTATLGDLDVPENMQLIASETLGIPYVGELVSDIMPEVESLDSVLLEKLLAEGFKVRELVLGSFLLDISLPPKTITVKNKADLNRKIELLKTVGENIIRLDLGDNKIEDDHLKAIAKFGNLRQLQLAENPITDKGISYLIGLSLLKSINLYKTNITNTSIPIFIQMENLQKIYAWQSLMKEDDVVSFNSQQQNQSIILGL